MKQQTHNNKDDFDDYKEFLHILLHSCNFLQFFTCFYHLTLYRFMWLLQEKINEFLVYKRAAKSFRADLCNRKDSLGLASLKMFLTLLDMTKVTRLMKLVIDSAFDLSSVHKKALYSELQTAK